MTVDSLYSPSDDGPGGQQADLDVRVVGRGRAALERVRQVPAQPVRGVVRVGVKPGRLRQRHLNLLLCGGWRRRDQLSCLRIRYNYIESGRSVA